LSATLISISENIIVIVIIFFIMYSLYRFLVDIKLPKKFLWKASLVSTIMLVAGKFGLGGYLASGNFSNIAGASASIIVLMIWVFYSSCIPQRRTNHLRPVAGAGAAPHQPVSSGGPAEGGRYQHPSLVAGQWP
jgi:hypothetical protein